MVFEHQAEIDWLRHGSNAGAIVATACSGAMMLPETGLLNSAEATTHRAFGDALARYPGVRDFPHRALVVSGTGGRLIMAGGGTSREEAMHIARLCLIKWHHAGQLPFAAMIRLAETSERSFNHR